jgi:two-component system OmpR family sensor kinase/two-component system sensor histidine kinase BaeS
MNKLWVRLTLAFGLVAVLAILVVAVLSNYQVSTQFRHFMNRSQMMQSPLVPALADYYAQNQSWAGVETVFAGNPEPGMGMGRGQNLRRGVSPLVLANAAGTVVYPETGVDGIPPQLSRRQLAQAMPVMWQNQTVGYLFSDVASSNQMMMTTAAQTFLVQINRSLLQAGILAGLLAVLMGLIIARSLSAPLGRLALAARRISRGELDQRVPVGGADEVADVAGAFNEMAVHLQESEILRRNLVADVAHELRTPLSVIQGNLQAILDDVYPLDKTEIAAIYDETLILNRLINDLRELAQAEAGQLSLNLQPIDLGLLLKNGADTFAELSREKNVALKVTVAEFLPAVLADSDRVRQVLHNLLSNALRHTPEGGTIAVTAVELEQGRYIKVMVADSGSGIPAEDVTHVFDRFWRADRSRSRELGGSGLGLAIARQLVEAHGGQIGVESEGAPGQGSRFWFTLPGGDVYVDG